MQFLSNLSKNYWYYVIDADITSFFAAGRGKKKSKKLAKK